MIPIFFFILLTCFTRVGYGNFTTIAPTTSVAPIHETEEKIDIVFSGFVQVLAPTYQRVLSASVNISSRRISFLKNGDRIGYAFGYDTIVRVSVLPRYFGEELEPSVAQAREALKTIIGIAAGAGSETRYRDLKRIFVKEAHLVPENPRLYTFKVYTTADLLYTFIYVGTALLYVSFSGFVVYKFINVCRTEREEKTGPAVAVKAKGALHVPEAKYVFMEHSEVDKRRVASTTIAAERVLRRQRALDDEDMATIVANRRQAQISPALEALLIANSLPPQQQVADPFSSGDSKPRHTSFEDML